MSLNIGEKRGLTENVVLLEVIFFLWFLERRPNCQSVLPQVGLFYGENKILAAFSSNTTKFSHAAAFQGELILCLNQFIFRMICCTYTFFCNCSS